MGVRVIQAAARAVHGAHVRSASCLPRSAHATDHRPVATVRGTTTTGIPASIAAKRIWASPPGHLASQPDSLPAEQAALRGVSRVWPAGDPRMRAKQRTTSSLRGDFRRWRRAFWTGIAFGCLLPLSGAATMAQQSMLLPAWRSMAGLAEIRPTTHGNMVRKWRPLAAVPGQSTARITEPAERGGQAAGVRSSAGATSSTRWSGTVIDGRASRDGSCIDWNNGTYWVRNVVFTQWFQTASSCTPWDVKLRWRDESFELFGAARRVPQAA